MQTIASPGDKNGKFCITARTEATFPNGSSTRCTCTISRANGTWSHTARGKPPPRVFALSRIEEWRLIGDEAAFRRPPDFDAEAFLAQGLQMMHGGKPERVVIAFDAYQSRWIRERQYHPSQSIEELPNGGLLLSFEVTGLSEVKRWVMAYGSHATVRQPVALRHDIAREIAALQKNYEVI